MELTVGILAGGRSRRMGCDKALLSVDGIPLLQRVINAAHTLTDNCIIISNSPSTHASFLWPLFPDRFPNAGPLGGLATALHHTTTSHLLLLACDMPNLTPALLQCLIDRIHPSHGVIVPEDGDRLQPLCAIYSRSILPLAESAIGQGRLSMQTFVRSIDARIVQKEEWAPTSEENDPFANLNTPEEYGAGHRKAR
ncbi:MAG: molybdenum cofactor guanylyltransferase [Candidatus Latescibacterota bacterium]